MAKKKEAPKKSMGSRILFGLLAFVLSIALLLVVAGISSHFEVVLDGDGLHTRQTFAEEEFVEIEGIHGFLSRVEYNNHTAYILGSMHMGRADWFPLADIVEEAMARSDVFAFEVDLQLMDFRDGFSHLFDGLFDDWDFDDLDFDDFDFEGWDLDGLDDLDFGDLIDIDDELFDSLYELFGSLAYMFYDIADIIDGIDIDDDFLDYYLEDLISDLAYDFMEELLADVDDGDWAEALGMFGIFGELFEPLADLFTIFELFILPDRMTLEDVLSADDFENLVAMLETFPNIAYEDIEYLTPVAAAMIIMERSFDDYITVYDEYSVDFYVMDIALAQSSPVIGLNSISSELELMFDIPMHAQATVFEGFLDWESTHAILTEEMEALIEAYETQNAESIRNLISFYNPTNNAYIRYQHDVFLQRCGIFAEEILRLLRETEEPTTFFITMGAAHLLYGHIYHILEANGLEVTELWR